MLNRYPQFLCSTYFLAKRLAFSEHDLFCSQDNKEMIGWNIDLSDVFRPLACFPENPLVQMEAIGIIATLADTGKLVVITYLRCLANIESRMPKQKINIHNLYF